MVEDGGGRRGTAGDGGKKRKSTENSGRRRGTAGDDGDDTISSVLVPEFLLSGKFRKRRDGTTECRPSSSSIPTCRATLENDRTGRQAAVRPRPGSGRTDCPVANTGCLTHGERSDEWGRERGKRGRMRGKRGKQGKRGKRRKGNCVIV